jgi:cellulose synthase (UDP-forming)
MQYWRPVIKSGRAGTHQKLNHPDVAKAVDSHARAQASRKMVERHGGLYHARERNEHAKAGNINAALACTDGELIAILDTDHVSTASVSVRRASPP